MENTNIQKATEWLLSSGIQNPNGTYDIDGKDVSGSFNAWFNPNTNEHAYIYIEISGYAVTMLCYLYHELHEDRYLKAAERAGDWLLTVQHPSGAFPTAFYTRHNAPKKPKECHTFDAGMVINGLAMLYRETKKEAYLASAIKAADWICSLQKDDGSIPGMVDCESGVIKDNDATWSTQSGPYHAKLAIGFLHLHELTGKERFKKASRLLCDYAATRQKENGQFLTYGSLDGTNLHPHTYSAEGLFVAGTYLNEARYVDAARKATAWTLSLEKDGIVPRHKHDEHLNYNERLDILAQTCRMATLLGIQSDAQKNIIHRLPDYQQSDSDDVRQRGGFRFGKSSTGEPLPHVNAWVTMFALQALMLADSNQDFPPFYLV